MLKKKIRKIKQLIYRFNNLCNELQDYRFFTRRISLEDKILNCFEKGVTDERYCDAEIIVSLTSYGRRINDVCFTIESLMQQTRKANRIILWLDENLQHITLPVSLKMQQARGLEIKYTKDIRSYKKLIPTLKVFPEATIITADDDVIYEFDILDRMISSYIADPTCIHACRMHTMTVDEEGNILPYIKWKFHSYDEKNPKRNFITGVGGVLYPPHCFSSKVLDETVFMSICPTADDVWFTAMALLNGTLIKKVNTRNPLGNDFFSNESVQDMALSNINVGEGNNDRQIKAVFEKYDILRLLK